MRKPLRVYQLAVTFYRSTQHRKLGGGLRNQFLRAASSIALNLHEGAGRQHPKDRKRFFHIAFGSIRECQAVMDLQPTVFTAADLNQIDHLAASVYRLVQNAP